MSLRWMTRVFAAPAPSGTDRLLLLALADHANERGVCWPGIETLQAKCGLGTRRAAEKALARVVAWSEGVAADPSAGVGCVVVSVERREGRVSHYTLALVEGDTEGIGEGEGGGEAEAAPPERGDGTGVRDGSDRGDGGAPEREDGPPPNEGTGEPPRTVMSNPQPAARARTRAARPRGRPPSASVGVGGGAEGDAGLIAALVARGVGGSWPARHLAEHGAARVRAAVAAWDGKRRAGERVGVGLLVQMIREGAPPPVPAPVQARVPARYVPPPMPTNGGRPPEGVDLGAIMRQARIEAERAMGRGSDTSDVLKKGAGGGAS